MGLTRIKAGLRNPWQRRRKSLVQAEETMTRVMMLLFSMIATTLMGTGVVVALTMGRVDAQAIIAAAVVGFVLAIPVSWFVAKQITG